MERLTHLKFNPLLCSSVSNFSLCKDLDPDSNFYLKSDDCEYYTEGSFNNRFAESQSRLNLNNNYADCSDFTLLHLNIRSISNKLDNFSNFLGRIALNFSVIGITETWLDDISHSSDIPGFNFIHNHRVDRVGGGVGLYLADHLNFKQRADFSDGCAESLFVEINRTKEKNIVIGVIYRPPDWKLRDFISELDQLVNVISRENKSVFLLGDYNLDMMKQSTHQATGEFLDVMFSRMFFPLITRPTRITSHKASLIDNIFTNEPLNQPISGLFVYDISDHLPIFAIMPGYVQTSYNNKYFTFRDKNPENLARFKSEIETVNWAGLPDFNNPSRAYGAFLKKYKQIFNRCFLLKKVKAKNVSLKKPWFSKALLKSVRKKNILYKRFLNNPTSRSEFLYKCYKNKLNHTIRVAKRLYYGKKIEEAKSNIKNTWRLLNEILNGKSKKQLLPSIFNIGEQELSDPTQIAEQFCKYFTNIGPSLASNIPVSQKSPHSFLSGNFVNSVF